jgi:hypothetical protein
MTVNEFYDTFFCDRAPFGLDEYCRRCNRKDVVMEPWALKDEIS